MEYLAGILIHIFCYLNLSVIEDYLEKILIKNTINEYKNESKRNIRDIKIV